MQHLSLWSYQVTLISTWYSLAIHINIYLSFSYLFELYRLLIWCCLFFIWSWFLSLFVFCSLVASVKICFAPASKPPLTWSSILSLEVGFRSMVDVLYQCLVEKQAEEKTCLLLVRFMQRREVLVSVVSATRSQKVLLLLKVMRQLFVTSLSLLFSTKLCSYTFVLWHTWYLLDV